MRYIAALIILFAAASFSNAEYVTVSLRSVANDVDNYMPKMPVGLQTLGGVPFDLLPASDKNAWNAQVDTSAGTHSTRTMVLPVTIKGATAVDTLINTLQGAPESNYVSLSFVCSDGTTHTATLKEGTDIRDWFDGLYVNKINGSSTTQVFAGTNHGRIDKQHITLPDEFANKTLSYIILTDAGVTGNGDVAYCKRIGAQRAFIYGVTVTATGKAEANVAEQISLDRLSQEMTDEAISKLKGKAAKQMSDLLLKYQKDQSTLAQQRHSLDDEMGRETLELVSKPA